LKINPQNANIQHSLAKTLLDKGDVDKAIELYKKLLPPLPDDLNTPRKVDTDRLDYPVLKDLYISANINYANALVRKGDLKNAERRFKEALRLAPDAVSARKGLEKIEKK
jgi:tetratricopeptide (TPR) repeat protein